MMRLKVHYTLLKNVRRSVAGCFMRIQLVFCWALVLVLSQSTQAIVAKKEPVTKLRPQLRVIPSNHQAQSISLDKIKPFLWRSLVLDNPKQFTALPYVLSDSAGPMLLELNATLYVRGVQDHAESTYDIYQKESRTYLHPKTQEVLGVEALVIGSAELENLGDPAIFKVTEAREAIEPGARLAPSFATELPVNLALKPAKTKAIGYILSSRERGMAKETGVGQGAVVIISMGSREGLEEGQALEIYRPGSKITDPLGKKGWKAETLQLPDRAVGRLFVFQVHEKLSLALITHTSETIALLDIIKSPQLS